MERRPPSLLKRARAAGPGRVLGALRPRRIDSLLYVTTARSTRPRPECAVPVRVHRYDHAASSGDPVIDAHLNTWRVCYQATVHGEEAHQSWLYFDTTLPALFGHDRATPVIGNCHTHDRFRGLRIYPYMLGHVVGDIFERGLAEAVYVLVAASNAASIAGIERAGFELRDRLRGVRVGPWIIRGLPGMPTR